MTRSIYDILEEPKGNVYHQVLDYAREYCDAFLLVARHSLPVNQSARDFIGELKPFLLSETEESEWFGTQLFGETALVYRYKLCHRTIELLSGASNRLFSWIQPDLPEDLCFIRSDGTPWLVTISHEEDGYFSLSSEEKTILVEKIHGLTLKGHVLTA